MGIKKEVLVFFSYRSHRRGYIEMLFDRLSTAAARATNLQLYRGSLSDLRIIIKDSSMSVVESLTGRDLSTFDLVYFELWYKAQQQALAAARFLDRNGVPYFSKELYNILPITKVGELSVLADQAIPLPNTFISSARETKRVFKKNPPINFPLIVKAADGYGGKNNYLVHSYKDLVAILNDNRGVQFVIQEFIPNNCDYRCLVLGGKIAIVLKRSRNMDGETHLNNTSAGAVGEVVPLNTLPIDAQDAVLKAAKVLNRFEFAGVDLMLHLETNQPYILEVNQTPQIEIGAEIDKKITAMLKYMQSRIGA
jgi:glutathione synthase/RimK-type ligase-like ATP-grasp enzyme